jgi:hypothetical protein
MISQADMIAVLGFRTGPGRSEFTFYAHSYAEGFVAYLTVKTAFSSALSLSRLMATSPPGR